MKFVAVIVRRPVTILMLFLVLIGLGLLGVRSIPIEFYPEVELPVVQVVTRYDGADPRVIENNVTRVLESALSSVGGIVVTSSSSAENLSSIGLEFSWGTDLTEATNHIREQLELVRSQLPRDAEDPQIRKFDPSSQPILYVALQGDLPLADLLEIADDAVRPLFERIEGIGEVTVQGGRERQIRVDLIQNRLEAFGLTAGQVVRVLESQNQQIGGGRVNEGSRNLLLRTSGEFADLEQVRNTVVAAGTPAVTRGRTSRLARPIRLRDVAEVSFGLADAEDLVLLNGIAAVNLAVRKQSGTNSVAVADAVKAEIERLNPSLPSGTRLEVAVDSTSIVRSSLANVASSMLIGLSFAVLVLFFFLRNLRTTLIIGLSIPISLLLTVGAMYWSGVTLNVITLTGLIIGLGMIVDASIVVLENIYTKRTEGLDVKTAAVHGTQEMISAVTASALTTICVFLPIILMQNELGLIGVMFGNIAITIVYAILASLVVAVLLVPVLASTYVPLRSQSERDAKRRQFRPIAEALDRFFERLDRAYARAIRSVLAARVVTLFACFALFAASLLLFTSLEVIFAPPTAEDSIAIALELPVGTRLEETERVLRRLTALVVEEFDNISNTVGIAGSSGGPFFGGAPNGHFGELTVNLLPLGTRTESVDDIEQFVRDHGYLFPGVKIRFSQSQGAQLAGADPIDIAVISDDLEAATGTAYRIQRIMRDRFPEIVDPVLSVSDGRPELEIVIDRDRAYAFGLSTADIGKEIRTSVQGRGATKFRTEGDEIDIFVSLRDEDRSGLPDLEMIFLTTPAGESVPVSSFAVLQRRSGPVTIERENEQRIVRVTGGLRPGAAIGEVQGRLEESLKVGVPLPDGVRLDLSGEQAVIEETSNALLAALIIAIFLVFSVMASQFESFRSPFMVVFTIPLMLIGVVGIYLLMGQPFSMFSFMGLIMLAGIVVNNGIVLVDYTNLLRARGMGVIDACAEAGRSRLRPVLMTTLTTMLGMVPLAFFPGEAAMATQPVALTIVGGLLTSTLLTLFVIPVLYSIISAGAPVRREDTTANASR